MFIMKYISIIILLIVTFCKSFEQSLVDKDEQIKETLINSFNPSKFSQEEIDSFYLTMAIEEALIGQKEGGIPIGSVITYNNVLIGKGHNQRVQRGSPILHGETDAINNAGNLNATILKNTTLYTTLSPCQMCSGAILLFGIPRVVICDNVNLRSEDGEGLLLKRGIEIIVVNNEACIKMMKNFIDNNKDLWSEDAGEASQVSDKSLESKRSLSFLAKQDIALKNTLDNSIKEQIKNFDGGKRNIYEFTYIFIFILLVVVLVFNANKFDNSSIFDDYFANENRKDTTPK